MSDFEKACVAEIKRVREFIGHADLCNRFEFSIKAEGRVSDGDVLVKFTIGLDYDADVTGNSIEGALYEAMRRRGWHKTNEPLCLPVIEEPKIEIKTDVTGVPF